MNELTLNQHENALLLHNEVITSGEAAAYALARFCKALKEMKDSGLYTELGCADFSSYCEEKAGIKARMAYNYISTYERLGEDYIKEHSSIGITKLEVLSRMLPEERESIDAENTYVAEIKRLQKEMEDKNLEIESLIDERDKIQDMYDKASKLAENAANELQDELDHATARAAGLAKKLEFALQRIEEVEQSADAATHEPAEVTEEQIEAIRKEVKAEYEIKASEDLEKQKVQADKIKNNLEKTKERLKELSENKAEAEAEIEALKKKLKHSDGAISTVKVYFNEMKDTFGKMLNAIDCTEGETRDKLLIAADTLLSACREKISSTIEGDK